MMDQVDKIMAYEQGDLNEDETVALFQELVTSGLAWKLQGHYGRMAKALIDAGRVIQPDYSKPEPKSGRVSEVSE